ncbi:response regulator [Thermodesulfobacteriota bacterium]
MEKSNIVDKHILVVDDEPDILETIEDILFESDIDTARDFQSAIRKIKENHYDLAILDIMGVNGLELLEVTVSKGIPTVMLTAHAINPETLMESIRKGAISYLPKEMLVELDDLLNQLVGAYEAGEPPWKLLFEKLEVFFNERFGSDWKDKDSAFWSKFSETYQISEGIKRRLKQDRTILDKGI